MGVNNGIVTAPINPQEVYGLLGLSAYNGAWDIGHLCSNAHGKINMWSRFKPVNIQNAYNVDYSTAWYKGTLGDCGITPKRTTYIEEIPAMYDNNNADWEYSPPFGDKGGVYFSPFRLLDFSGYSHKAMAPVSGFVISDVVRENGNFTCSIRAMVDIPDGTIPTEPGSLRLNEIEVQNKNLSQWYLGAVITDTSGNMKFFAAGNKDEIDGTWGVAFPSFSATPLTKNNSYYIYPFFAKNPQEQGQYAVNNEFITMPGVTRQTFKVVEREEYLGIEVSLTAEYLYMLNDKARVTAKITVKCKESSFTFRNNNIYFKFDTSNEDSYLQNGEYTEAIPDFTVAGNGGTYTNSIQYNIPVNYRQKNYYVYLMLQSGSFRRKAYPLEKAPVDPGMTPVT